MKIKTTFDTLAYANKLKAAGIDAKLAEAQAEANAEMISTLLEDGLATKQDLFSLQSNLEKKFILDNASLKQELKQDIKDLEIRLTLRLGGIVIGSAALMTALLSAFRTLH